MMRSSWSAQDNLRKDYAKPHVRRGRTNERIRDEDEDGLQSVHPLEFLKQSEIKRRICLAIR